MRRIGLVLSAAALLAAITAFSSVSAFAQEEPGCITENPSGPEAMGIFKVICVENEVRSEEVRTPTTEACQLGNSSRQGTQEGELVQTDEVTYQVTTTTYYQGNPLNNQLADVDPNPLIEEVELSRVEGEPTFEPTGRCEPVPGRPA